MTSRLPSRTSPAGPCYAALLKPMPTLQQSFPGGTQVPRNIECTMNRPTPKSLPTVEWIRVVLYQHVVSLQLLTQPYTQLCLSSVTSMTQEPNFSPTSTTGTCGSSRIVFHRQLLLSQLPPDQSTLLHTPPKHKYGKALAKTPFHLSSKTRSRSHLVVWEDIYKSMETLSPALSFWASRLPWRKQHNAFRKLPPRLQTLTLRDSMCRP